MLGGGASCQLLYQVGKPHGCTRYSIMKSASWCGYYFGEICLKYVARKRAGILNSNIVPSFAGNTATSDTLVSKAPNSFDIPAHHCER